ncbi:peptidoglycan-binding domain-containing protein [Pseudooceanicola algae]|uniref:Peptidoglycan binding domain protein n=1 Tax=Pseudooceanicola algae TaxID=1537215 RepID=A0A418SCY5_9RHOB|nr:hypothetical protein [Pseudooceanicola algae]QPM92251.1 hypothetical protein PSAL_035150 [Pseudooceanicola algae]
MTARRLAWLGGGLLSGALAATQAQAAPCVGAGYDRIFPGATDVVTGFADVPSPRFPGLWQEGRIGGYAYQIYANGEASVSDPAPEPAWEISVQCDSAAKTCAQTTEGTPPEPALRVAEQMGLCFTAPESVATSAEMPSPPAVVAPSTDGWALSPPPQTETTEVAEDLEVADDSDLVPPAPCGLATIEEGTPGVTFQRLLIAAGADPGPVDGLPGPRTRAALSEVLGEASANLASEDAIAALDSFLCAGNG